MGHSSLRRDIAGGKRYRAGCKNCPVVSKLLGAGDSLRLREASWGNRRELHFSNLYDKGCYVSLIPVAKTRDMSRGARTTNGNHRPGERFEIQNTVIPR